METGSARRERKEERGVSREIERKRKREEEKGCQRGWREIEREGKGDINREDGDIVKERGREGGR